MGMAGEDDPIEDLRAVGMNAAAALSRAAEVLIRAAQETKARRLHAVETDTAQGLARQEAQTRAAEQFYARVDVDQLRQASPADVAATWQGVHQWRDLDPDRFTDHADRINHDVAQIYGLDGEAALETYDDITVQETAAMIRDVAAETRGDELHAALVGSNEQVVEYMADRHGIDILDPAADPERISAAVGEAAVGDYNSDPARASRSAALDSAGASPEARQARMTADYLHAEAPRPGRGAPSIAGPGTKAPAVKRARTPDRGRG